jgi:hypothetical protein
MCREEAIAEVHFVTRQFNHITWTDSMDLRAKLTARIEATLPTRPALVEAFDA